MEFLNNIWTAISTPNETLITLLSIPLLLLIEAPLTYCLISNFFNIKFSKKTSFYLYTINWNYCSNSKLSYKFSF